MADELPIGEQKVIAAVLDHVANSIAATDKIIATARELKKSLMKHLFTYGPVPIDQAEQVILEHTVIGELPDDWSVRDLGDLLESTQYGLSVKGNSSGSVPMLRMNSLTDGRVTTDDLQYVDLDDKSLEKYRLRDGDVLFNRTNSIDLVGKTSLFDLADPYVFASYLIRLVPTSGLDAAFLNYYLNFGPTQRRIKGLASRGVSQSNVSATRLKTLAIPLPPVGEQRKMASILKAADRKVLEEENRKSALETLFNTLLHQLMTGQIRVTNWSLPEAKEDAK